MTRAREYLRGMWWRHGPGASTRLVTVAFIHGMHAEYHTGTGASPCDDSCARMLAQAARV